MNYIITQMMIMTEAVGFYEKLGYVADPKQITGTGAFQCIMTEKQL